MFKYRFHILFIPSIFFFASLMGQVTETECGPEIGRVDFPALENFLRSKRSESVADKLPDFKISGDVRIDFLYRKERQGSQYIRGGNATDRFGIKIPSDLIALKTNLKADYVTDKSWMVAQIEFDNNAGINGFEGNCGDCDLCPNLLFGSGFCDYLCLKRAYAGYELWKCDDQKLTVEIGRRSLYYVFDSRIQYKARVDGLYGKYSNTYAKYEDKRSSNFYVTGSYFLIDKRCNHFGYAFETGLYNVCDSGFDWKASFINWRKHGLNQCNVRDPLGWRFTNAQINCDYNFKDKVCGHKLNLYSAFLINFAATNEAFNIDVNVESDDIIFTRILQKNPNKENRAWYIGFIWGEVKKKGDFSFDCNYQYVEASAVSDCDIRGIGRGNANKDSFSRNRRGNSNYKGLHSELLYAITDRFQLDISWDFSRSVDKNIGVLIVTRPVINPATGNPFINPVTGQPEQRTSIYKNHVYSRFEIELIHAF